MTVQEMKKKKQEKGYTYAQLSELSGVPRGTIQKIFTGETLSPRYDTLRALESVLSEKKQPSDGLICEPAVEYGLTSRGKNQGEYTLDDYYAIPDEYRVELIDGVIYDMAAPTSFHQIISGETYRQIANFIFEHKGNCMPFISPIDVQLDNDEKTIVQPDVIIICNRNQVISQGITGAPDFVLEVISPGTKRKDYTVKLQKYQNAGVREYWLVDPYQKIIIVYYFESDSCPSIYPFDSVIPVNIFNEVLKIDFSHLVEWLPL